MVDRSVNGKRCSCCVRFSSNGWSLVFVVVIGMR